jgi:oligoendopeptidase F
VSRDNKACPQRKEALVTRFDTLPASAQEFNAWPWPQIAPYYDGLLARPLSADTVAAWLADWTRLSALLDETNTRYTIATTVNTADQAAETGYKTYLDTIVPPMGEAEQRLKQKLIDSGLEPAGFAMPLLKLRTEAELFREANLPLLSEERKLGLEYEQIAGARTVQWEGEEIPVIQLYPVLEEPDRDRRERAWRTIFARVADDTPALAPLWRQMVQTRDQIAHNAGLPDFRAYKWRQLFRFDYTPDDAQRFHAAIAEVAVPATTRLWQRRRQQLGVPTLRHWDLNVDPQSRAPLRPYATIAELEDGVERIFRQVDPQFAAYFATMRAEGLLDLESRKNKAPGGYSLGYAVTRQPFIFTNATRTHGDVQTLLHEGGHAFHTFECAPLPYLPQWQEQMLPMEFAEVASMGMELLSAPYLTRDQGGFYTEAEAARARLDNLREIIAFWPYMAMIDALQHWIYEHPADAADIERCDDHWETLVDRYWPGLDWSGVERAKRTYWHQQSHVFTDPFYYIEYGIAQLGAVQVWANAQRDPAGAAAAYRRALALGATVPLPQLYAAAGAKFAFDADTLRDAVGLLERTIAELEPLAQS